MGKYKQWLHHQEVGARLRDEIAAHEAEREQVLKLAPTRASSLPDLSNPIIAALLGQAPEQATAQSNLNGASATASTLATEVVAEVRTGKERSATADLKVITASKTTEANGQIVKEEAPPTQEEAAPAKPATINKAKASAAPAKNSAEKQVAPTQAVGAPPAAGPSAQPDTIDPMLEQLLAQAESVPADPLEVLNLLASQGPNLTRGDAPQSISTLSTAPLPPPPGSAGQSALKTLLGEAKAAPEPQKATAGPASASVAVGVEVIATAEASVRAEAPARGEKGRSDTDELVAARPTEGYTEPRLIVPQWLRSMELGQEGQDNNQAGSTAEEVDGKQRFSVSLPFENEEDMRLHESVERWWQRWRQQS